MDRLGFLSSIWWTKCPPNSDYPKIIFLYFSDFCSTFVYVKKTILYYRSFWWSFCPPNVLLRRTVDSTCTLAEITGIAEKKNKQFLCVFGIKLYNVIVSRYAYKNHYFTNNDYRTLQAIFFCSNIISFFVQSQRCQKKLYMTKDGRTGKTTRK